MLLAKRLQAIVFCLALLAPLLASVLEVNPLADRLLENRALSARPPLRHLSTFPRAFDAYYQDRFGLRSALVSLNTWVAYTAFGEAANDAVVAGRDGWLFLASEGSVDLYRRLKPLSPSQLRKHRRALEERTEWLAARGVPYVFAVAPEKATVYPEHMPRALTRLAFPSRLDQLAEALDGAPVTFVDLRAPLRAGKDRALVYDPTDSHWNELGAYAAYAALLNAAGTAPQAPHVVWSTARGGDLAKMLGLASTFEVDAPDVSLAFDPPRRIRFSRDGFSMTPDGLHAVGRASGRQPTGRSALVFHDSFAQRLYEFVTPHFDQVSFYWTRARFWPDVVEAVKPSVVFHVVAERGLLLHPLTNPVLLRATPSSAALAAHRRSSFVGFRDVSPRAGLRLIAGRIERHAEDAELITVWESLTELSLTERVHVNLLGADGRSLHALAFELDDPRETVASGRVWEDVQVLPLGPASSASAIVLTVPGGAPLRVTLTGLTSRGPSPF